MSMTGLGLEWSRRKHPELRRKLQPTDYTATTTAAQPHPPQALPPLPKRVEPANASDAADASAATEAGRAPTHALRTPRAAQPRPPQAPPPLPKRGEPANASDAADAGPQQPAQPSQPRLHARAVDASRSRLGLQPPPAQHEAVPAGRAAAAAPAATWKRSHVRARTCTVM